MASFPTVASSNWLALKKQLGSKKELEPTFRRKRRKMEHSEGRRTVSPSPPLSRNSRSPGAHDTQAIVMEPRNKLENLEYIATLRKMVLGHVQYAPNQELPGKYLALDCEMVGVGIDGAESSLARVSLVNFYGAVVLDEFVRQRERVVDYRTQFSGIRPSDMANAKPFDVVQKQVAELLKDRILVGQAVHNDLKVLLLSHPHTLIRDTQILAFKSKLTRSRRIALRNLVKQELDLTIQQGEHSSVTDARATMAVYRLHKKEWEKGMKPTFTLREELEIVGAKKRRKSVDGDEPDLLETRNPKLQHRGGGRKGVSSGLSTIICRGDHALQQTGSKNEKEKSQWWKQLPSSSGSGVPKSSLRLMK